MTSTNDRAKRFYQEAIRQVQSGILVIEDGAVWRTSAKGKSIEPRRIDHTSGLGYMTIAIRFGGSTQSLCVHKLVWMCAYGDVPDGHAIDHIDGDKSNNNLSNLEAVPYSENTRRAKHQIDAEKQPRPSSGVWKSPQLKMFE